MQPKARCLYRIWPNKALPPTCSSHTGHSARCVCDCRRRCVTPSTYSITIQSPATGSFSREKSRTMLGWSIRFPNWNSRANIVAEFGAQSLEHKPLSFAPGLVEHIDYAFRYLHMSCKHIRQLEVVGCHFARCGYVVVHKRGSFPIFTSPRPPRLPTTKTEDGSSPCLKS